MIGGPGSLAVIVASMKSGIWRGCFARMYDLFSVEDAKEVSGLIFESSAPQHPIASSPFNTWSFPDGSCWLGFYRLKNGYLLRFDGLADFLITEECRCIQCIPVPNVSAAVAEHLYLNQVLPLVLSKQGKLVFHASAVEIDGVAVAFFGASGLGKSTLAASFGTSGYRFLTDDGLILEENNAGYAVQPSHPSIRLWADSQVVLIPPGHEKAPALEFTSKARFPAGGEIAFCDSSRMLCHGYFLGPGIASSPRVEQLSATEALQCLLGNSFLIDVEEKELLSSHFERTVALAQMGAYFKLDYPRKFDVLPAVRQLIVDHVSKGGLI